MTIGAKPACVRKFVSNPSFNVNNLAFLIRWPNTGPLPLLTSIVSVKLGEDTEDIIIAPKKKAAIMPEDYGEMTE